MQATGLGEAPPSWPGSSSASSASLPPDRADSKTSFTLGGVGIALSALLAGSMSGDWSSGQLTSASGQLVRWLGALLSAVPLVLLGAAVALEPCIEKMLTKLLDTSATSPN